MATFRGNCDIKSGDVAEFAVGCDMKLEDLAIFAGICDIELGDILNGDAPHSLRLLFVSSRYS